MCSGGFLHPLPILFVNPESPDHSLNHMDKALAQAAVLIALFLGTWFLLSQFDYIKRFNLKNRIQVSEQKLGDKLWEFYSGAEKEETDSVLIQNVHLIKNRLCLSNRIDTSSLKFHVFRKTEVNAFALPNGHIVIHTGLIKNCKSPEELAGVIAHEIAHVEKKHVMNKLVKEAGIALLSSVIGGSAGAEILGELIKMLSSSAYDRKLESEADAMAVKYLLAADLDPQHFANFLFRLSTITDLPDEFVLLNSHPNSKDRAAVILETRKTKKLRSRALLDAETWRAMQQACE
jgi:beta-barrel assembly-enhancing protease